MEAFLSQAWREKSLVLLMADAVPQTERRTPGRVEKMVGPGGLTELRRANALSGKWGSPQPRKHRHSLIYLSHRSRRGGHNSVTWYPRNQVNPWPRRCGGEDREN